MKNQLIICAILYVLHAKFLENKNINTFIIYYTNNTKLGQQIFDTKVLCELYVANVCRTRPASNGGEEATTLSDAKNMNYAPLIAPDASRATAETRCRMKATLHVRC